MKPKGGVTAAEFLAELEKDEDYQRRRREQESHFAALGRERARKLAPFTADLEFNEIHPTTDPKTGWLVGDSRLFRLALDHLNRDGYDDETRATIARNLTSRNASSHWREMAALYQRAEGDRERDALAGALSHSARGEHVDDMMKLVEDDSFGGSRILFLRPINRLRRVHGREFVSRWVEDPVLGKEADAIMRRISTSA